MPNYMNFVQVVQPYHATQAEQMRLHLLAAKQEIDQALKSLPKPSSSSAYEVLDKLMSRYSGEERQTVADIEPPKTLYDFAMSLDDDLVDALIEADNNPNIPPADFSFHENCG